MKTHSKSKSLDTEPTVTNSVDPNSNGVSGPITSGPTESGPSVSGPSVSGPSTSRENVGENKYVVLMETSGEENESWYYCIKYNGNEDNLQHLQDQLETVDWFIIDDLSTFDLDLEHPIRETTAKELTKLDLNHHSFHRKFDGKLKKIDLHLRKKDKNEKKMSKVFDILGYGQIEDYIDGEDIDEEDLTSNNESSDEDSSGSEESDHDKNKKNKKKANDKTTKPENEEKKGIPPSLLKNNLPRFAKIKRKKFHKK